MSSRRRPAAAFAAASSPMTVVALLTVHLLALRNPPQPAFQSVNNTNTRQMRQMHRKDVPVRIIPFPRIILASAAENKSECCKNKAGAMAHSAGADELFGSEGKILTGHDHGELGGAPEGVGAGPVGLGGIGVGPLHGGSGGGAAVGGGAAGGGGGGSGKSPCCGVMPMYFVATTHTIILFQWWETLEEWQYILSVFVCILLGVVSIGLKVLRVRVEESLVESDAAAAAGLATTAAAAAGTSSGQLYNTSKQQQGRKARGLGEEGEGEGEEGEAENWRLLWGFPIVSNICRMLQAFILYGFDYLLMLIVMSYNVGLFFAVIGGLALGVFFFGHLLVGSSTPSHHAKRQQQQQTAEMQDFHAADPLCCGA